MPMGVDTRVVTPMIIRLPTMALRKPPPSLPGAGVSWVKKSQPSAEKPL
jgi:hypothetical protein